MKLEKRKYSVRIANDVYTLVSDEPEEQVSYVADLVDTHIKMISEKMSGLHDKKAAVLAAIQIASSLVAAQRSIESICKVNSDLIEKIDHELLAPIVPDEYEQYT